jgi:hypothetical protein
MPKELNRAQLMTLLDDTVYRSSPKQNAHQTVPGQATFGGP